jgi:hypothetical protein
VGKRVRVGFKFHSFLGKQRVIFHLSLVRYVYKIDSTKHTSSDPYFQPL